MIAVVPVFTTPGEALHHSPQTLPAVLAASRAAQAVPGVAHVLISCADAEVVRELAARGVDVRHCEAGPTAPPFLPPGSLACAQDMAAQDTLVMDFRTPRPGALPLAQAADAFAQGDMDLYLSASAPRDHPCQFFCPHQLEDAQLIREPAPQGAKHPIPPALVGHVEGMRLRGAAPGSVLLFEDAQAVLLAYEGTATARVAQLHTAEGTALTSTAHARPCGPWLLYPFPALPADAKLPLTCTFQTPGHNSGHYHSPLPFRPADAPWTTGTDGRAISSQTNAPIAGRQDFPQVWEADGRFAFVRGGLNLTDWDALRTQPCEAPLVGPALLRTRLDVLRLRIAEQGGPT